MFSSYSFWNNLPFILWFSLISHCLKAGFEACHGQFDGSWFDWQRLWELLMVPIDKAALIQVMAWRRVYAKPSPEAIITLMIDTYMCHQAFALSAIVWKLISQTTFSNAFGLKRKCNNIPGLVQIMVWHRPGDKPLSEPVMVSLLTHKCVVRPQWVKLSNLRSTPSICSAIFAIYIFSSTVGHRILLAFGVLEIL